MIKNDSCPSCGKSEFSSWDTGYINCNECELVFRDSFPEPDELERIYKQYYSKNNINQAETNMVSNLVALRNQVKFIKKIIKPGCKILDFGAGTGDLVMLLIEEGFRVDGCELSRNAREEAFEKYGLKFHADLKNIEYEYYDLIISVEVIEHLTNPHFDINNLTGLLKKEGLMYFTTPNRNGLVSRIRKSHWREASKPFHLILFNFNSLKYLLNKCGLKKIKFIRYSPLTTNKKSKMLIHRFLQFLGLYGGLRVICQK